MDALKGVKANFYDVVTKAEYAPTAKDRLSATFFLSNDQFKLPGDSLAPVGINSSSALFNWRTNALTVNWEHAFSDRFRAHLTGVLSSYRSVVSNPDSSLAYRLTSQVRYLNLKASGTYTPSPDVSLGMGMNVIRYVIEPGSLLPDADRSQINPLQLPREQAVEAGFYGQADLRLARRWSLLVGLRYVWFGNQGTRHPVHLPARLTAQLRDHYRLQQSGFRRVWIGVFGHRTPLVAQIHRE